MPAAPTIASIIEPQATFRFGVEIDKQYVGIFTEAKLPDLDFDHKEFKEGGQNDYVHWLPGRRKAAKVTLKNGLTSEKVLLSWYKEMMGENYTVTKKKITITMMDAEGSTFMTWSLEDAYPSKLVWPDFKTSDNTVAIQTLEFVCHKWTVE